MANIFLSYKKEDFEIADRLVAALRKEGMSVWWDDGLTPKAAWDEEIEREISDASTVVVLWSPRSVSSEWVRREAHFAQERGKLVPVIVEATSIPLAFTLVRLRRIPFATPWHIWRPEILSSMALSSMHRHLQARLFGTVSNYP